MICQMSVASPHRLKDRTADVPARTWSIRRGKYVSSLGATGAAKIQSN